MNSGTNKMDCSVCHARLAWWNASNCALCGKVVCGHHMHLVKRAHSHVLVSVCGDCTDYAGAHLETIATTQVARQFVGTHRHVATR